MEAISFETSVLQPALYHHRGRSILVVAHVDDFLCTGAEEHLDWLHGELRKEYDLTIAKMGDEHEREAKYLNLDVSAGLTRASSWRGTPSMLIFF